MKGKLNPRRASILTLSTLVRVRVRARVRIRVREFGLDFGLRA
jgi:hypothetical protein